MVSPRRLQAAAVAVFVIAVVALSVTVINARESAEGPSWSRPAPVDPPLPERDRGGSVRIGVSTPPEVNDLGNGGDTLRSLVLPQLFVAQPDGSWRASLVEPGSDSATPDGLSASFRLRDGAAWSNDEAITVEDLRRSADGRFVAAVDSDATGLITVRFAAPMPGWRRLWSGSDFVDAPTSGVFGGPYRVQSVTSGLETVLVRNEGWRGGGAFLDDIHLVLTADPVMERQLLLVGKLDVIAPVADTVRTPRFSAVPGMKTSRNDRSGYLVGLRFNPKSVPDSVRKRIASGFPRTEFVDSLLANEATRLDGLARDSTLWKSGGVDFPTRLDGAAVTLTSPTDQPLTPLLQRSFAQFLANDGGKGRARNAASSTLKSWERSGEYEVMLDVLQTGPDMCWSCEFADIDATLATAADAGDANAATALEARLRDEALFLPLWRASAFYVWRDSTVDGLRANGYSNSVAWNAFSWWKP